MEEFEAQAARDSAFASLTEAWEMGGIQAARFGKTIYHRNALSPLEHKKLIAQMVAAFPDVVKRPDSLVTMIVDETKALAPIALLHQVAWAHIHAVMSKSRSALEPPQEHHRALRYLQSVIVSSAPAVDQCSCSQDGLDRLLRHVREIYTILTLEFFLSRSAHQERNDPAFDSKIDGFAVGVQLDWIFVRGERFQAHEIPRLRALLMPHSDALERCFGVRAEQLVEGFARVLTTLTFGPVSAIHAYQSLDAELVQLAANTPREAQEVAEFARTLADGPLGEKAAEVRRQLGPDLFEVLPSTELPLSLLDLLASEPGSGSQFLASGEYRGLPLRQMPTSLKPFLQFAGRYYCFDAHFIDDIYRSIQRALVNAEPDYREQWNLAQESTSVQLTVDRLAMLFPGAKIYQRVYYAAKTGLAGRLNWCETDVVVLVDDILVAVEIKAGAFTSTSPATDFDGLKKSARELIEKPAQQANRLLKTLLEGGMLELCDSDHKPSAMLDASSFGQCIAMCVTLDSFTHLAAKAEYLTPLGIDLAANPAWVLNLDDLVVYSEILRIPGQFIHFMKERLLAIREGFPTPDDELDHLGPYLHHLKYGGPCASPVVAPTKLSGQATPLC
ncbi:MAG: hypothetical protein IPK67_06535 [Planctomycetes bacterium]|nr:hypothetical protein [Planctomycetota bacterium]